MTDTVPRIRPFHLREGAEPGRHCRFGRRQYCSSQINYRRLRDYAPPPKDYGSKVYVLRVHAPTARRCRSLS